MNILIKLSLRYLVMNRKRTLVTVVAVMLAGALIFSVVALAQSAQNMIEQYTLTQSGNYHISYSDISWKSAKEYIRFDSEDGGRTIDAVMFRKMLGFAEIGSPKNEMKPYITLRAMDKEYLNSCGITLEEGRLPENGQEIALSRVMLDVEKLGYRVGDTVTLSYGWRYVTVNAVLRDLDPKTVPDDQKVIKKDQRPYLPGDREEIKEKKTSSFTVVGILSYASKDSDITPGYPAYTYYDTEGLSDGSTVDMAVRFKDYNNIYTAKRIEELAGLQAIERNVKSDLRKSEFSGINFMLNKVMGLHQGVSLAGFFSAMFVLVLLMILFASVTVIYNSFAISISERKKQFGMLKSVGATPAQLLTSVVFEAVTVSLVGVPLGLLCGFLGVGAVLRALAVSFIDMSGGRVQLCLVTDPGMMLLAAGLILAVVLLSALIPAIQASRMTPVEAIRQSASAKSRGRGYGGGWAAGFLGFEAVLALKNLRRSSRKYITAVLSLVISVAIILAFTSFGQYADKSAEKMFGRTTFDIRVALQNQGQSAQDNQKILTFLNTSPNIVRHSKVTMLKTFKMPVTEDMLTRRGAREFPDLSYLYTFVYTLDDETFRRYAGSAGLKAEDFMDPQHPRAVYVVKNGGFLEYYTVTQKFGGTLLNLKPGDSVGLQIDPEYDTLAQLEVGALAHELPVGLTTQRTEFIFVIPEAVFKAVTERYFETYGTVSVQYFADVHDDTVFQREFRELFGEEYNEDDYVIYNQRANRLKEQAMGSIVSTLGMMYILLICCIGILNVYNTVNTAMELRRKEFFILKSVGMTPRGLGRMLDSEGVFFSLASLLTGVPVGILASYYVYRAYTHVADLGFAPPWLAMLAAAAGVFLAVYGTMFFFRRRIRNEPIVETLRQENF